MFQPGGECPEGSSVTPVQFSGTIWNGPCMMDAVGVVRMDPQGRGRAVAQFLVGRDHAGRIGRIGQKGVVSRLRHRPAVVVGVVAEGPGRGLRRRALRGRRGGLSRRGRRFRWRLRDGGFRRRCRRRRRLRRRDGRGLSGRHGRLRSSLSCRRRRLVVRGAVAGRQTRSRAAARGRTPARSAGIAGSAGPASRPLSAIRVKLNAAAAGGVPCPGPPRRPSVPQSSAPKPLSSGSCASCANAAAGVRLARCSA